MLQIKLHKIVAYNISFISKLYFIVHASIWTSVFQLAPQDPGVKLAKPGGERRRREFRAP